MTVKRYDFISYLLLIGTGLIWGAQFVFNKIAVAALPPFVVASGRVLVAAITMTILLPFFDKAPSAVTSISKRSLYGRYLCLALLEAIWPFAAVVWGQQYVSSSMTSILFGLIPFFVIILALVFVPTEKVTMKTVISLLVGFVGLCLLLLPQAHGAMSARHLLAMLAILSAALSFAIAIVIIQSLPAMSPIRLTRNVFILAAVPMVIICLFVYPPQTFIMSLPALLSVVVLGTLCSGVVYVLYIKMIARAGVTFASLCNYLVPVFGSILGISIFAESLRMSSVLALLLIFSSLVLHRLA